MVGFSEIVVQDGGCLREHQTPKTLFNNVGTVTIAKGGTLDLLQTNEITGAFYHGRDIENAQAGECQSVIPCISL